VEPLLVVSIDCEPEPCECAIEADPKANGPGDKKFAPAAMFIASFFAFILLIVKVLESLVLWR